MKEKFSPQELQAGEWIKRAKDDELNAKSILKHRDGTPGAVCFLSNQMAEKYLKAFLVSRKQWFPKIHPLDTLAELCREIDSSFERLKKDAIFLNSFYMRTRYPGDYPEFTWQEAEKAFKAALKIKEFVLGKLKSIEAKKK